MFGPSTMLRARPQPRMFVAGCRCSFALLVTLTCANLVAAQSAIRSIAVSTVGDEAAVTIEAGGPLPAPTLGALDGPPRIFLDFAGVQLATRGLTRTTDPRVRRVRAGIFSVNPLVTRVVIDLTEVLPHRLELATGRVMVFIGAATPAAPPAQREPMTTTFTVRNPRPDVKPPAGSSTPAPDIPPVPPLPSPAAEPANSRSAPRASAAEPSGARSPHRPASAPPPAKDVEKYRAQVMTLLERLKLQRPLLDMMQTLDEEIGSRMPAAMQEFDRLRGDLEAIKPPETLRVQHDLLLQAARLGSTAARLRLEAIESGDGAVRRNAASAAAGATLMLDRAFADVGFGQDGR
jgi:AMIN domain